MGDSLSEEQKIMIMMRKVLAQIVKDVTPASPGIRNPLREDTIQAIRECFRLIADREKALMEAGGNTAQERPYYVDDPDRPSVISFDKIKKKLS